MILQTNVRDFAPIKHLILVCRTLVLFFILVRYGTHGCFEARIHFGQIQASFALSQTSSSQGGLLTVHHILRRTHKEYQSETRPSRRKEPFLLILEFCSC